MKVYADVMHRLHEKGVTNGKEIMLYSMLCELAEHDKEVYCTPTNKFLSERLCVSERQIRNYLSHLKKQKVIELVLYTNGFQTKSGVVYRIIWPLI